MRGTLLLAPLALIVALSVGAPAGHAQSSAQTGPTLTVIGFGLANVAPAKSAAPQMEMELQASGATASGAVSSLAHDVAAVEQLLEKAGVQAADISVQAQPGLNYVDTASQANCQKIHQLKGIPGSCPPSGFQANEGLQVDFPSLTNLADALTASGVDQAAGVQNFYINQGNQAPSQPSSVALQAAYAQALQNASDTASLLAHADHLTLGPAVSLTQGAQTSTPCGGMGCGPAPLEGISPPQPGPNQQLVAVTVSYSTTP